MTPVQILDDQLNAVTVNSSGQLMVSPVQRSETLTLKAAGAVTAAETVTGDWTTGLGQYRQIAVQLKLTDAKADVGDTLDVFIDTSFDGGTTAVNCVHFTQILGNGADAITEVAILDPGGTPGTDVVDATSDLASGKVAPTLCGDALRVRYVVAKDADPVEDQSFNFSVVALCKA